MSRNVVITGAGSGLGLVAACRFASAGDRVFVCDLDAAAVDAVKSRAAGIRYAEAVDVSDRPQLERFFAAVNADVPYVDVLINNVGMAGSRAPLEEIAPDEWTQVLNANLNAAFWACRAVLPAMKQRASGCILNVSTASVVTLPLYRSPYTVSKAALEALTVALAREVGPHGVRCNAVRPGLMDNDRLKRVIERIAAQRAVTPEAIETELLAFVSLRRKVSMSDVAELLFFLASDAAAGITAQLVGIDGGMQWES